MIYNQFMKTTTRINKWGNSLAIRIPVELARELGLSLDSQVEITSNGTSATLTPGAPIVGGLDDLVAGITSANQHDAADWGVPAGKEAW